MQDTQHIDHQMHAGTFMVGLLCGAAIGSAIGFMFAPKRGVDLRRQVVGSADRLRQQASDAITEASDAIQDVMTRSRQAVDAGRQAFTTRRRADRGINYNDEARFVSEAGPQAQSVFPE